MVTQALKTNILASVTAGHRSSESYTRLVLACFSLFAQKQRINNDKNKPKDDKKTKFHFFATRIGPLPFLPESPFSQFYQIHPSQPSLSQVESSCRMRPTESEKERAGNAAFCSLAEHQVTCSAAGRNNQHSKLNTQHCTYHSTLQIQLKNSLSRPTMPAEPELYHLLSTLPRHQIYQEGKSQHSVGRTKIMILATELG